MYTGSMNPALQCSLEPGGVVVMECAIDYVGRNGMLKKFDDLRIERYEIVRGVADWYDRRERPRGGRTCYAV